jgi:hypothetical protein
VNTTMKLRVPQDVGKFLLGAQLAERAQLHGIGSTGTRISAGSRCYSGLQHIFRYRAEYQVLKYAKKRNLPPITPNPGHVTAGND